MNTHSYFIHPARITKDDAGNVISRKPAILNTNDGSERRWKFASTDEAKDAANLWFGVETWERDDLNTLWSVKDVWGNEI